MFHLTSLLLRKGCTSYALIERANFIKCIYLNKFSTTTERNRFSISQVSPVLQKLISKFNHRTNFHNLFKKYPEFNYTKFNTWADLIDDLDYYDFSRDECLRMIEKEPSLVVKPNNERGETLQRWHIMHLPKDEMSNILIEHPHFINIKADEIEKRVSRFNVYCKSRTNLPFLLYYCPNIMTDPLSSIEQKYNYLNNDLKLSTRAIVKSRAFAYPLHDIKLRIALLQKCGVYKILPKFLIEMDESDKLQYQNPPFEKIVTFTNSDFSKHIAGITLEEYKAFEEIYEELKEDDESDDETDDDDSDEENCEELYSDDDSDTDSGNRNKNQESNS